MRYHVVSPVDRWFVEIKDSLHGIAKETARQDVGNRLNDFVLGKVTILILIDIDTCERPLENVSQRTMS